MVTIHAIYYWYTPSCPQAQNCILVKVPIIARIGVNRSLKLSPYYGAFLSLSL